MNKKIPKKMKEFKEENIINQNEIINEESDEKESTIIEINKIIEETIHEKKKSLY